VSFLISTLISADNNKYLSLKQDRKELSQRREGAKNEFYMFIVIPGLVYGEHGGLGEEKPRMHTDYGVELKKRKNF